MLTECMFIEILRASIIVINGGQADTELQIAAKKFLTEAMALRISEDDLIKPRDFIKDLVG